MERAVWIVIWADHESSVRLCFLRSSRIATAIFLLFLFVQYYANAVVCNIHGVAPQFLSVPGRMLTSGQNDSATVSASASTLAPSASESREGNEGFEYKGSEQTESSGGEGLSKGLEGNELPLVFDKGCYFIGKVRQWALFLLLCSLYLLFDMVLVEVANKSRAR